MKSLAFALALLVSPAFAENAPPAPVAKTYEQGVCAGYRYAGSQMAQGRQQLVAIVAGARSEVVGLMLTMIETVVFSQLTGSVTVDGTTTDCTKEPK